MSVPPFPPRPTRRGALAPLAVISVLSAATIQAQTPRPDLVTTFRPLRFDESYAYLRDSVRHGWWQPMKYVPLGSWSSLSFGGEVRAQYGRPQSPRMDEVFNATVRNLGASPVEVAPFALVIL